MKIWGSAWYKVGIKRRTFPELPSKIEKKHAGHGCGVIPRFSLARPHHPSRRIVVRI